MSALFVAVVILYVFSVGVFLLVSWYKDSTRELAFKALTKSLKSCECIDESVIRLVFDNQVKDTHITYASFVEKYRLYLLNGHSDEVKDLKKLDLLLREIIEREQSSINYTGIDENDWRAMVAIENTAHDGESLLIVKKNLGYLSNSIRKNKKKLESKEKRNKWSFFFTILGVLLTIFAFIMDSRLSNKDYNNLDGHLTNIENKVDNLSIGQNELRSSFGIADEEVVIGSQERSSVRTLPSVNP